MKASRFRSPGHRVVSSPVALVWLFAFALRCLYLWQIADAPFFDLRLGDAEAYHAWAQRIADGDWLGQGVFYQAPLYPYLLALIYTTIGDSVLVVRIVQAMLGATSCALLGAAGVSLFGRLGAIAGVALAIYPSAIYFDGLLDKTSLMTFLVTALLALIVVRKGSARSASRWLTAGLVLGLVTLTRENAVVLIVPLLVFAHLSAASTDPARQQRSVRSLQTPPIWLLTGLLIILLPVGLRNLARGGEFQLTTAQLGPNLYIGNHSGASGTYESLVVGHGSAADERDDATRLAQEAAGRPLSAREVSRFWTGRALAYIREQPHAALVLFARKMAMTFSATEISDTETQDVYAESSRFLRALGVFDFGVLLGLAAFGTVSTASDWRRLWILHAIALTYALSVATFYVLARYRFALVPVLMLLAAGGIVELFDHGRAASAFRRKDAGRSHESLLIAVALAMGVTAVLISHAPLADERGARAAHYTAIATALARDPARVEEARHLYERALAAAPGHPATEFAFATLLSQAGRHAEAIPHYRTALAVWPDYAAARFNLAVALMAEGQPREAADHLRETARLRPDDAETQLALAKSLVALGRALDAIPHYERALAINPNDANAHNDLGTTLANEGRIADALPHFERAVMLDPANERARKNLEMARRSK